MTEKDIRWIQRFHNFKKALGQLAEAVELAGQRDLSKLEKQGVIQAFEFTHELAWNTLKDFLESRGAQKERLRDVVSEIALGIYHQAKTDHATTVFQRRINAVDRQIDQLVYELYGLTEEEIGMVEGSAK